jgi:hypothetical protein
LKKSVKSQISKALGQNVDLNKKAIQIKRSWDEVAAMIGKNKSKPKD